MKHIDDPDKTIVQYQSFSVKGGQDVHTAQLTGSTEFHYKRFRKIRDYVCWEAPSRLFGFGTNGQVLDQLKVLTKHSGYPPEVNFTLESFRVGSVCKRAISSMLDRENDNLDTVIEDAVHLVENVKKETIKSYLGNRLDRLKGTKRKFDELSVADLHPTLEDFPLQGPFQKEKIGKGFVASATFMEDLSKLYEEVSVSGGVSCEKLTDPGLCRPYCIKIGRKLFGKASSIDISMRDILEHLVRSGKRKDSADKTKGMIVFCMTSCGELDHTNWRGAKVPEYMSAYFKRENFSMAQGDGPSAKRHKACTESFDEN